MALVDPNIAMSYRGIELPNQLAQYGQVQQIQAAQNQNRLADLQYRASEMALNKQRALQDYRAQNDPSSAGYYSGLRQIDPMLALEEEGKQADIANKRAEGETKQFDLKRKKIEQALQRIGASSTPQQVIDFIVQDVKDGTISMQQGAAKIKEFESMGPEDFAKSRMQHLQQILSAGDQMAQFKRTTRDTDRGGYIERQIYDAQGMPLGAPQQLRKTPTIGDMTAQGNLSLAQQKFKFEQANPGITVQQTEDGTLVGVNNRTGQAMPITMGGAVPMAPAAAPASNAFSPRLPSTAAPAVTQAIPGMPSVLDQRAPVVPPVAAAPAAPIAGTPLRGKGTAMTQEQQKSAMFGASMLQAQNVIQDVASRGTYKSAIVPGVLEGLVKLAPFGVGDAAANAIESTFRTDPTSLVGPNVDQQKLAQAQIAFATAYLRSTSGAAFGPSEVANTIKEFFPLRGEGDAVIKQKEEARDRAVEGMAIGSNKEGRAYMDKYRKPSGTNVITNPQFPGFSIGKP